MSRPVSDWQAQDRGAWEYEQWLKTRDKERFTDWERNHRDTLGVKPAFPTEVLGE